ncbi:hypothetical protein DAY19_14365 [Halobacteriovorax vibrionivorans]|uniref:Restriction endonuclease n=1 Tax=Halobacteriovorax vibrionivorans TaxID=2152716 RepID=A0ABY0IDX5_9BACT|nr:MULTISPECIES: hypothetical protein [Halobacteriovorax]RZF21158.1 hypothetical protein DAY19_14365 [Halobacteriovorax vibrionivorans]TGD46246.1 hypothetical protein EP118_12655 [Halobacteriovorax sp. Y22]
MKLKLDLFKGEPVPISLLRASDTTIPVTEINIDHKKLSHYLYFDEFNLLIAKDHQTLEMLDSNNKQFRFIDGGLGDSSEIRRGKSNALGRAFCKMMLSEHWGIKYYWDVDRSLKSSNLQHSFNITIRKNGQGDKPDFFCARDVKSFFLAEAKGRGVKNAVNFTNGSYRSWLEQFTRISIHDLDKNKDVEVKGYIVATRLLCKSEKTNVIPNILVKDPKTFGEINMEDWDKCQMFSSYIMRMHYVSILKILGFEDMANLLQSERVNSGLDVVYYEGEVDGINYIYTKVEANESGQDIIHGILRDVFHMLLNTVKGNYKSIEFLDNLDFYKEATDDIFIGLDGTVSVVIENNSKGRDYVKQSKSIQTKIIKRELAYE